MELTMCGVSLTETLVNELFGWGDVPVTWLDDRVREFADQQAARLVNVPMMTSTFNGTEENDWHSLFVMPATPNAGEEQTLVDTVLRRVTAMPDTLFKIEHIHDGVRCIAFM